MPAARKTAKKKVERPERWSARKHVRSAKEKKGERAKGKSYERQAGAPRPVHAGFDPVAVFTRVTPTEQQQRHLDELRAGFISLAQMIQEASNTGPQQMLSLRALEDASMRATKAVLDTVEQPIEEQGAGANGA